MPSWRQYWSRSFTMCCNECTIFRRQGTQETCLQLWNSAGFDSLGLCGVVTNSIHTFLLSKALCFPNVTWLGMSVEQRIVCHRVIRNLNLRSFLWPRTNLGYSRYMHVKGYYAIEENCTSSRFLDHTCFCSQFRTNFFPSLADRHSCVPYVRVQFGIVIFR